ncbi:MAG: amidophosphoribosyltransferase [Candidatus Marinimicrobia bacterium]|nr:amidophosphoribosyltransferase [Candidatus Neomarinimicrobiota bacterium]
MCGIVGISSNNSTASLSIYNALTVLQHRGQDAAGMAVIDQEGFLNIHKRNGLVRDAFDDPDMIRLQGNVGIGHVRYPTAGTVDISQAQPFYVNSPHGIVLVHNGNLINTESLRDELRLEDFRHINTTSDSEVLINIFASSLEKNGLKKLDDKSIFKAVAEVHKRVEGAYSVIIAILGYGLIAFRDPNGIRPLIFGCKDSKNHIIASESVALDCLGYSIERDIEPGETIIFKNDGTITNQKYFSSKKFSPCIFEYVYLARPDSTIENINVYESRLSMGRYLAKKIKKDLSNEDLESIDVIIPIPATSRTSALPISIELDKELKEGFVKNRYIGRTFIMPGQKIRKKSVRQKLNTINIEFKNKNVLLVDDSIVRGNTSKQIIKMAREAGAKKVFFASASPPIRFPNVYGIDMPYVKELVAYKRTIDEIAEIIGADKLIYQSLEDLISAVKENNTKIDSFDSSCFDGSYVTGGVDSNYLKNLHKNR